MGILKNIHKTGKGAIKGIIAEFQKNNDFNHLIESLDNQIDNYISNKNYIKNNININNNSTPSQESIIVNNIKDDITSEVRESIEYNKILEENKEKINEQDLTEEEIKFILSGAVSSIVGTSYNGYSIDKLKNQFFKSLVKIYFNFYINKLLKTMFLKMKRTQLNIFHI